MLELVGLIVLWLPRTAIPTSYRLTWVGLGRVARSPLLLHAHQLIVSRASARSSPSSSFPAGTSIYTTRCSSTACSTCSSSPGASVLGARAVRRRQKR